MSIYIDIDSVKSCAQNISNTNKTMLEDFNAVETAVQRLGAQWIGSGSNACTCRFGNIKNTFLDDSFKVIDNLANFMFVNIGDQYNTTESGISKAASEFK